MKYNKILKDNDKKSDGVVVHKTSDAFLDGIRDDTTKKQIDEFLDHKKDEQIEKIKDTLVDLPDEQGFIMEDTSQEKLMEECPIGIKDYFVKNNESKYGPYNISFTRNGNKMILSGKRGEFCSYKWKEGEVEVDLNLKKAVYDAKYLHIDSMMAVASEDYLRIFDNKGTELHLVKSINSPRFLEYLPYHYLLAAGCNHKSVSDSFIFYLDISKNQIVSKIKTQRKFIKSMTQNPTNAIVATSHSVGTVNFWDPNIPKNPCLKIICHPNGVESIAINKQGTLLATSGTDSKMKLWDLRYTKNNLTEVNTKCFVKNITFSQTGLLACDINNTNVNIFRDLDKLGVGCHDIDVVEKYLTHNTCEHVYNLAFAPYEDVLAIGLKGGYETIIAPGSASYGFDAFDMNIFDNRASRKEAEVKNLLRRIPMENISIDKLGNQICEESLQEEWEKERRKIFNEPEELKITEKPSTRLKKQKRKPGVGSTAKAEATRNKLHWERVKKQKEMYEPAQKKFKVKSEYEKPATNSVLDEIRYKKI